MALSRHSVSNNQSAKLGRFLINVTHTDKSRVTSLETERTKGFVINLIFGSVTTTQEVIVKIARFRIHRMLDLVPECTRS